MAVRVLGALALLLTAACAEPPELQQQVGYRTGEDGANSGERGTVKITEIGWAGSVTNDGVHDPRDVFLEIRNESQRPMRLDGWFMIMEGMSGAVTWRIPEMEPIPVGSHMHIAAKADGCFPNADLIIDDLYFGAGDGFRVTLRDADERLIEPAGNRTHPPYAGIWDGQVTRSMEKVELVFGGRGSEANAWHHYTQKEVEVPNNDLVAERCRQRTLASPGRPNSPDYSGAFSAGGED